MAYTPHGHYIRGSEDDEERVGPVIRCGGPGLCKDCSSYAAAHKSRRPASSIVPEDPSEITPIPIKTNFPEYARRLVYRHVKTALEVTDTHVTFDLSDVYVVWHCKTLQHWKALVSTALPDGMYYEVTHNGDKRETYIDSYKKFTNTVIPDYTP